MLNRQNTPIGKLSLQVVAMPSNTNPAGDIFGGWIISQMDLAGGIFCRSISKSRVVTVSIESMEFKIPVFVGDTLSCYVSLLKEGNSSLNIKIESWIRRDLTEKSEMKATQGIFTFVKVDENGKPIKKKI